MSRLFPLVGAAMDAAVGQMRCLHLDETLARALFHLLVEVGQVGHLVLVALEVLHLHRLSLVSAHLHPLLVGSTLLVLAELAHCTASTRARTLLAGALRRYGLFLLPGMELFERGLVLEGRAYFGGFRRSRCGYGAARSPLCRLVLLGGTADVLP